MRGVESVECVESVDCVESAEIFFSLILHTMRFHTTFTHYTLPFTPLLHTTFTLCLNTLPLHATFTRYLYSLLLHSAFTLRFYTLLYTHFYLHNSCPHRRNFLLWTRFRLFDNRGWAQCLINSQRTQGEHDHSFINL